MSHYRPYPAYKNSGVEWLGKVPRFCRVGNAVLPTTLINSYAWCCKRWAKKPAHLTGFKKSVGWVSAIARNPTPRRQLHEFYALNAGEGEQL